MDYNYQLTVVTTVRNLIDGGRMEMIRQCIRSVYNQKISGGVEHILADGGSTDGTVPFLEDVVKNVPYKKDYCITIFSKPDHQIFEGMNNGLAKAHGKYVVFLNSDDCFIGTKNLEKSLNLYDAESADVGYADTYLIRKGHHHRRKQHSDINKLPFQDHFIHQSMVTKTSVIRAFGGFDLSLTGTCLENDLTMRLLKAGKKFVRSPYCFCMYSLDGFTGKGTGVRSQHPDMFFKHFGADIGLTLEECIGLRYFEGISYWTEEECRRVLSKLQSHPEWAAFWESEINAIFKDGKRTNGSFGRRLSNRWQEDGISGIVNCILRKVKKGGN